MQEYLHISSTTSMQQFVQLQVSSSTSPPNSKDLTNSMALSNSLSAALVHNMASASSNNSGSTPMARAAARASRSSASLEDIAWL